MSDNKIAEYYNEHFHSQAIDGLDNGAVEKFRDFLIEMGMNYLDDETINAYNKNINIVRKDIIQHIIRRYLIQIRAFYLSVNTKLLDARSIKTSTDKAFFVDELLEGFILEYLFSCTSVAYDPSEENIAFICRHFSRLCKDYILNHSFPIYEEQRVQESISYMSKIPESGSHHAANYYWCIITFLMGHEIFHLLETADIKNIEMREIMADNFGIQCLIDLIKDAENGEVSDSYNAFDVKYYMAPYLFFEMYIFINKYSETHGLAPVNQDLFFTRKENAENEIFKRIPEQYNTEEGNDLLNNLLDASDIIQKRVLEEKENEE